MVLLELSAGPTIRIKLHGHVLSGVGARLRGQLETRALSDRGALLSVRRCLVAMRRYHGLVNGGRVAFSSAQLQAARLLLLWRRWKISLQSSALQLIAGVLVDHTHLQFHGLLRGAVAAQRPRAMATAVGLGRVLHVLVVLHALCLLNLGRSAQHILLILLHRCLI